MFTEEMSEATLTGKLQPSGSTQDLRLFRQHFTPTHHEHTLTQEPSIWRQVLLNKHTRIYVTTQWKPGPLFHAVSSAHHVTVTPLQRGQNRFGRMKSRDLWKSKQKKEREKKRKKRS